MNGRTKPSLEKQRLKGTSGVKRLNFREKANNQLNKFASVFGWKKGVLLRVSVSSVCKIFL